MTPNVPDPSESAEPSQGSDADPAAPVPGDATPVAAPPRFALSRTHIVAGVVVVSMLFGLWGLWRVVSPTPDDPATQLEASQRDGRGQQREIDGLQQRVATLSRSDQISREANRDLQSTLAERDEEIAALRADVAFYERLVGSTAQRRGLAVHALAPAAPERHRPGTSPPPSPRTSIAAR